MGFGVNDYGAGAINEAIKGFIQGAQQRDEMDLRRQTLDENKKFREMEIAARAKTSAEALQRNRELDEINKQHYQREDAARGFAAGATFDENGQPDYTKGYRPEYLEVKKKADLRAADPFGIKAMEAEKLRRQLAQTDTGKMLPPDKVLQVQQGAQIPTQLADIKNIIETNKDQFGPVAGRWGSMNPYNTQTQTIDAAMRTASQSFGRFMEGGVLRKEDEEKYRKMFPNLSDTPEVAQDKLAIVNRLLTQKQNADVKALSTAGYDTSAFSQLEEGMLPPGLMAKGKLANNPVQAGSNMIQSGVNALAGPAQQNASGTHPQDNEAVAWAKQNPKDPRAIQILKANGL